MIDKNDITINISYDNIIYFHRFPNLTFDVFIKDINGNIICHYPKTEMITGKKNDKEFLMTFFVFTNIYKYNEFVMEFYNNDTLVYKEIFFTNYELSYIQKKDVSIIINNIFIIKEIIDYYEKFGDVYIKENTTDNKYKYTVILNHYLLDITCLLNTVFFDKKYNIVVDENKYPNLRFLK